MAAVLELIAGSYEQITFGYRVKTDEKVGRSVLFCSIEYYCRSLKRVEFFFILALKKLTELSLRLMGRPTGQQPVCNTVISGVNLVNLQ